MSKEPSKGEAAYALHCRAEKLNPVSEYKFHPQRKWRFDFCFVEAKLGIEIEGGTWIAGRHQTPSGFAKDCEKYSEAAVLGYRVLRFTTDQVLSGTAIDTTQRALAIGKRVGREGK